MKRLSLLLASLAATSVALATTYVRVEKDGSKTYSDRPLPGGQPVELSTPQTYEAPKNTSSGNSSSNLPAEQRALQGIDDFVYESCVITPERDATFTNPQEVTVAVTLNPAQRVGDRLVLTVDGRLAPEGESTFTISPVDRGSHTVQLLVKDQHGRVLCTASSIFHVFRPSVNQPGRR